MLLVFSLFAHINVAVFKISIPNIKSIVMKQCTNLISENRFNWLSWKLKNNCFLPTFRYVNYANQSPIAQTRPQSGWCHLAAKQPCHEVHVTTWLGWVTALDSDNLLYVGYTLHSRLPRSGSTYPARVPRRAYSASFRPESSERIN